MIGRTIGTYKVEAKIGEGGMGAVYKGVDLMLERTVAVKVLRPELAQQPRVLERFRSEAITLAQLNHPNIATLYSFLQDEDEYFMILEFVQGQTFEALLRRGAMPFEEATPLFCQALDGIAHAHAHGIVHRDIKPANVMLTGTGIVKVMDFGIARVLGTDRMTRTGHLIGTIEYMSPEQVHGQETDARSDIYSLGVLLYEMLTGRVPFEADSDFELMQAHVKQSPRSLRGLRPSVPAAVERAVLRAMAKKPSARFPDVVTFRDTLDDSFRKAAASAKGKREAGGGLAWFRQLFKSSQAASSASVEATRLPAKTTPVPAPEAAEPVKSTRLAEAAEPVKSTRLAEAAEPVKSTRLAEAAEPVKSTRLAEAAEPVKGTRLAEPVKGTRLASEAAVDAPPGALAPPRAATRRRTPVWKYAVAVVPVLLAVLAFIVWKPGWQTDGPVNPASDTSAVVTADTADGIPAARTPGVPSSDPALPPDRSVEREQPTLLSPEEFARLNLPEGQQPVEVPETTPATPPEQTPPTGSEPEPVTEEPERVEEEPEPVTEEPERVVEDPKPVREEPEAARTGSVRIIIHPFGDVYLDGQRKASGTNKPYVEEVAEGTYRVRAVHPRFGQWEKQVAVRPGKTHEVVFNFNRQYTLTVTSEPSNAEILVDGASTRRYTPSVLKVRPGQHSVRVEKRGYATPGGAKQLTIDRDVKEPVHFTLRENR